MPNTPPKPEFKRPESKRSASDAKLDILESVIRLTNNSKIKNVNIDFSNDENLETSEITIKIN